MKLDEFIKTFVKPNAQVTFFNHERHINELGSEVYRNRWMEGFDAQNNSTFVLMEWMVKYTDLTDIEVLGLSDTIIYDDNKNLSMNATSAIKIILDTDKTTFSYQIPERNSNGCECCC